jgi:hypothetical protein
MNNMPDEIWISTLAESVHNYENPSLVAYDSYASAMQALEDRVNYIRGASKGAKAFAQILKKGDPFHGYCFHTSQTRFEICPLPVWNVTKTGMRTVEMMRADHKARLNTARNERKRLKRQQLKENK